MAKLATISDGPSTGNFWPSWPEEKWCPSWTPFPSEHGLSKRFPSWEPFLRSTSGQVDQKLLVTMMVTVFAYGTSAHEGRKLKCGPSWSTFFLPGTSDQLDPKLEICAMMARIVWLGRRQKREPSWRTFLIESSATKMPDKLS